MEKDFNIWFTKNDENPETCTNVIVKINTGLPIEKCILSFEWQATHQYSAELLMRHLRKNFWNRIEQIREQAYEAGWKDAKSRKRKKILFLDCFIMSDVVGY